MYNRALYNRAHCKISTTKYMGKNFKTPQRNCHYKKKTEQGINYSLTAQKLYITYQLVI